MGKNYCKIEHKWCKFAKHQKCFWNKEQALKTIRRCPKRISTQTLRLKDILQTTDVNDVIKSIENWYPTEKTKPNNIKGYAEVFDKLRNEIKANKTDWFIIVTKIAENDTEYLNVTGKRLCHKHDYAMSFVPWKEWLGMNITQETLDLLTTEEIIAACLYEMTWFGFNETSPTNAQKEMYGNIKEITQ